MSLLLRINKVRESAKLPVRAHLKDAGVDLFFCPENYEEISVYPQCSAIIPTGLRIEVPHNFMFEIKNKSGIAAKRSLLVGACVVDCGYTGEIFVNLHNVGPVRQIIKPGDKIAQGVFVKVETDIDFVLSDQIYDEETARGEGSLGSTGDR